MRSLKRLLAVKMRTKTDLAPFMLICAWALHFVHFNVHFCDLFSYLPYIYTVYASHTRISEDATIKYNPRVCMGMSPTPSPARHGAV